MDRPSFLIHPEEAESAAKQLNVSVLQLLPLLVNPAKSLARPPISKYPVVAVGLGSSGRIFVGVNVEFPGLPLHHTIHAEQFLVANFTLNSERNLRYLAVSAVDGVPGAPCGHCRQFLQEIRDAPEIRILITDPNAFRDAASEEDGEFIRLESVLPHRFGPANLLDKGVPLLLEPHDNRLTLLSDPDLTNDHTDSDLKRTALSAAKRSYSPYSRCPSGVALVDSEGKVYRGWYMESAAYNPSLGPVQAALVDLVANGGGGEGFEKIVGAVLVEKKDAVVRQEDTARIVLKTIAPECDFKVYHCYEY